MSKLLSVVIANFNYGRYLEEAILSVLDQSDGKVELIICDAGSTDESVEIIRRYQDCITWWCSEKDKGQSDAFNKGFSHASGRFITWLNADDILLPGTVAALERAATKHPTCQWFTGNYLQFRQDTRKVFFAPWGPHLLPRIVQTFDSPLMIFGPTTFWSREAYRQVGPIDVDLHYSMDTDYWVRMKKAGYEQRRLNHCCWAFRMHEESKTGLYRESTVDDERKKRWYDELGRIHKRHGYSPTRWKMFLLRVLRIVDGSALIAIYRKFFIVGTTFERKH